MSPDWLAARRLVGRPVERLVLCRRRRRRSVSEIARVEGEHKTDGPIEQ